MERRGTNTLIQLQSGSWKHHPSLDPTSVTAPRVFYQEYSCFSKPKGVYYSFGQKCIKTTSWQILVPRIIEFLETGKALETIQFNPPLFTDKEADRCQDSLQGYPTNQWKDGSRPFHSLPVLFSLQGDLEKHW